MHIVLVPFDESLFSRPASFDNRRTCILLSFFSPSGRICFDLKIWFLKRLFSDSFCRMRYWTYFWILDIYHGLVYLGHCKFNQSHENWALTSKHPNIDNFDVWNLWNISYKWLWIRINSSSSQIQGVFSLLYMPTEDQLQTLCLRCLVAFSLPISLHCEATK